MKKTIIMLLVGAMLMTPAFANDTEKMEIIPISAPIDMETPMIQLKPQIINGVAMAPLSEVLLQLGYEIQWKPETQSVDILKGAQWTSIQIGENRYFRNRMAPWALSAAPLAIENRTWVPVEFFADILNLPLVVEDGNLIFIEGEAAIHRGYIHKVSQDEAGVTTITLTREEGSDNIEHHLLVRTSKDMTFYNRTLVLSEYVSVVTAQFMTMSIPGQTAGYVIY